MNKTIPLGSIGVITTEDDQRLAARERLRLAARWERTTQQQPAVASVSVRCIALAL